MFPSFPFNLTNTSLFIADDASEKKKAFSPNTSISAFETMLEILG